MRVALPVILIAFVLAAPLSARAGCRWEWICDEGSNCSHQPICDSSIDIVPPEPPSLQPIVPPSIKPIQPPTLPPIGTEKCELVRRCDSQGNCVWDNICY